MRILFLLCLFGLALRGQAQPGSPKTYDVVVYGATPAGIFAAINAGRQGHSVALVEEYKHIGGLMTGGLSYTDLLSYEVLGGTMKEYQNRVVAYYKKKYGDNSTQVEQCHRGIHAEPHVTLLIFQQMIAEVSKIQVLTQHRATNVLTQKDAKGVATIQSATFLNLTNRQPMVVNGRVFIDATYEGDLAVLGGAEYRTGREASSEYCEQFAGKIFFQGGRKLIGSTGEADQKVQGYNFRMIMTDSAENRRMIEKPVNYQRERYLPLADAFKSGKIQHAFTENVNGILRLQRLVNRKVDVNDIKNSPVRVALLGQNYAYPDGSPEVRARIIDEHKQHILGMIYFLQNDESIPLTIRDEAKVWGLAKDDFPDNENFPYRLYIREARRIMGEYVFTEHDTEQVPGSIRSKVNADAVAIGDYALNCHGTSAPGEIYADLTEGDFNFVPNPFQIPYGVMVPRKFNNLLVCVAVSSSHVGFNALRLEPTWSALGQAAGLAAHLSLTNKTAVNRVNVPELQKLLHKNNAKTGYVSDVEPDSPYFEAVQFWATRGLFHDLYSLREINITPLKIWGLQYRDAALYHDLKPELSLDDKLAQRWIERFPADKKARAQQLYPTQRWTRGGFLKAVYEP